MFKYRHTAKKRVLFILWIFFFVSFSPVFGVQGFKNTSRLSDQKYDNRKNMQLFSEIIANKQDIPPQNILFGDGIDSELNILAPATVFKQSTPEIYLTVEVLNIVRETIVAVRLVYLDSNEFLDSPCQTIHCDSRLGFKFIRPVGGWAIGRYATLVYFNNAQSGLSSFIIE